MADEKWSDLPAASSVSDSDYTCSVQGGVNKKTLYSVIKTYITSALSSVYVPLARTLTIGGAAKTLAADRAWTTTDILDGLGSPAQGNILYRGASNWVLMPPSTDGNVLTTHSTGANPTWTAPSGAPSTAHYLTSQSESGLSNEVNLGALTTGLLKGSVTGSVSTISSITDSSTNWDTAYTERHQWDGGSTNLVAATGRTSLGATTVGGNIFTVTNPSAIRFLKVNADNSVTLEDAATFRGDIGAGTGGGDASTNTATSVDAEVTLFSGTTGKLLKRATGTGIATLTSGVLSTTSTTGSGNVVLATTPTIATPDFTTGFTIGTTAASGKIPVGNGTNFVASTPTYPNTATSGKVLVGDGTNVVLSTPTFPNASATNRKIIVSDGTNWLASTETYAVPGTSGNVLTSDGTNWTSAAATGGGGTTSKVTGSNFTESAGSLTDVTGLTFAAASGKVYEVDVLLKVQQSTTGGMKFSLAYSGTGSGQFICIASAAVVGVAQTYETANLGTATSTKCTAATSDYTATIKAVVTTTGTGNITVQIQRIVGGTATCYIGSRMTVTLLA